ncbi:TetR/AcrR family transcriptional regulator [Hoyosella subflava]|uniref:TetR family transcriptional regulator n=1 Tax=Hoyosella subflava (strain DSM 45089 / JCM 17490 / NBRC 109087 / DQS3-9A1) TaxID=443218 RepID=F6ER24_HOYSD|nr:TetR/AcrR family transcriptional regulator [Hoyosella subflava]AEF40711.1 TetR family transcriptional regulator [Hoyosella subflava DQS3-9A1]
MHLSVTREDYFEAAMKILAANGYLGLKMTSLCSALGVTTGSFYNYFGSWDAFAPQLLTYWEKEQTLRIEELSNQSDDPIARMFTMKELATRLPHEAEVAIRAWSNSDPVVAVFQQRVDEERIQALRSVILGLVPDSNTADLLALIGISLLVGVQSLREPVDRDERHRVFDAFEDLIRGQGASPDESTSPKEPTNSMRVPSTCE